MCPNTALTPRSSSGASKVLDSDFDPAHRLLRVLVRALRAGLSDRRHPEDHEKKRWDRASRCRSARPCTIRAVLAVVDGDALHRVRGVLSDVAEGHLAEEVDVPKRQPLREEGRAPQDAHDPRAAAARRSLALHRLRRVRKGLPDRGQTPVYVTNAGETRAKTNVSLLENTSYTS